MALQLKAIARRSTMPASRRGQIDGILPFPNLGKARRFAANLGCENLRFAATLHMGGAAPVAALRWRRWRSRPVAANYVLVPGGWNGYSGARVRETVAATDKHSIPGGGDRLRLLPAAGPDGAAAVVCADGAPSHARIRHHARSSWVRWRSRCASTRS
jgi:hypothetical protein